LILEAVTYLLFTQDKLAKRAFFVVFWSAAVEGAYSSLFSKLLADDPINAGNLNPYFSDGLSGRFIFNLNSWRYPRHSFAV